MKQTESTITSRPSPKHIKKYLTAGKDTKKQEETQQYRPLKKWASTN